MPAIARRALLATPLLLPGLARAQSEYPNRPVTLVVPFPPGGGTDNLGRMVAQALSARLGQPVVVENRGGAGGNIGSAAVARAAPDGYTLLFNGNGMAIADLLFRNPGYHWQRDFVWLGRVASTPILLVVNEHVPARTLPEFIAYAKANPGRLNHGTAGAGTPFHLGGALFDDMLGTRIVHVPYRGTGPAVAGLLGNEVQVMFVTYSSVVGHVKGNRLRMLAVVTPQRIPQTPDVPTMREQGFDMVVGSWQGIFVPKGTPPNVTARLFKAAHETMKHAEVVRRLTDNGISIITSASPAEFKKFWDAEIRRFAKVIKDAGLETE
jgi:tripartite-type tricarboxylate transporter receptor subunit TctC